MIIKSTIDTATNIKQFLKIFIKSLRYRQGMFIQS